MFRLNRNERSHWSGNGVHVESELVFMIGRNMHVQLVPSCRQLRYATQPPDGHKADAAPSLAISIACQVVCCR